MEYVFLVLVILNGCWAKVIYLEINSMIIQMILFFNALKMSFKFDKFKNFSAGLKKQERMQLPKNDNKLLYRLL